VGPSAQAVPSRPKGELQREGGGKGGPCSTGSKPTQGCALARPRWCGKSSATGLPRCGPGEVAASSLRPRRSPIFKARAGAALQGWGPWGVECRARGVRVTSRAKRALTQPKRPRKAEAAAPRLIQPGRFVSKVFKAEAFSPSRFSNFSQHANNLRDATPVVCIA
jgi:hypothetical protein